MKDSNLKTDSAQQTVKTSQPAPSQPVQKSLWETPKLEDVSEQVMAQPYIRFT
jgi:hypothetical protein